MPNFVISILPYLIGVVLLLVLGLIIKACYKKAPPNTAMVITGPRGSRTVVGQGCFIVPILQRVDTMSLENIQSDFTSRDEIPTKDAINIMVDAVANVSIAKDTDGLKIAASKFLGYSTDQIREMITPVFEGNIREIISQTTLKELIQGDKKVFAERVIDNVTPNLRDMGLELTTFNIQNFKDANGVIANLGLENTVQISKDAAISKARAEKEIAVAKAEAEAAAIRAKAEAEADGMMKKAEALKEYGDAAQRQMELEAVKVLYEQLPKIAEAIGAGYNGADIHVIGEDSGALAGNMMNILTQITSGMKGAGIDPSALISGMIGGKLSK